MSAFQNDDGIANDLAVLIKVAEDAGGPVSCLIMNKQSLIDFTDERKQNGESGFDPLWFGSYKIIVDDSLPYAQINLPGFDGIYGGTA